MILRDRIESCLRVLDKYHYVQCTTALPSARCSCGLHLVKSLLRANWHQLEAERDALAADLAAARAHAAEYRSALRDVFFLDHNEREWQSLGECQEWARLECARIDAALAKDKP